jgi:hypothetical protein
MLQQRASTAEGRNLFWHYPNNWGPTGPGIGASSTVRSGDWKLIYYYADRGFELFNIREDIGEEVNLADAQPDRVRALAEKLGNYLRSVEAQRPVTKEDGKVVPWPDEALQ